VYKISLQLDLQSNLSFSKEKRMKLDIKELYHLKFGKNFDLMSNRPEMMMGRP
jgi:hypothetical protein